MSKGPIGLRHFMSIVAFFNGVALTGGSVLKFSGECVFHGNIFTTLGVTDDPAHREGDLAACGDFHWDLVSGATDAAGFSFKAGLYVFERLVESLERVDHVGIFAGLFDCVVDNLFGQGLFTAHHDGADQLGHDGTSVAGVDAFLLFNYSTTSGHRLFLFLACGCLGAGLGFLRSVFGAAAAAAIHAKGVEGTTDDVITDTWQIFDTTTADEDD